KERTGAVDLAANLDGPRLANAGLAAVLAAWTAVELPFFPHGFGLGLPPAARHRRRARGTRLPARQRVVRARRRLRRGRGGAPRRVVAGAARRAPLRVRTASRPRLRARRAAAPPPARAEPRAARAPGRPRRRRGSGRRRRAGGAAPAFRRGGAARDR